MFNFYNRSECTVKKAYHGITDPVHVISVSVWQVDVINTQQLVRGRPNEANLLPKRAWYQFNFLMRWCPHHGLILFGVSTLDKLLSVHQTEFNACQYCNNLSSEWTVLTPAPVELLCFKWSLRKFVTFFYLNLNKCKISFWFFFFIQLKNYGCVEKHLQYRNMYLHYLFIYKTSIFRYWTRYLWIKN